MGTDEHRLNSEREETSHLDGDRKIQLLGLWRLTHSCFFRIHPLSLPQLGHQIFQLDNLLGQDLIHRLELPVLPLDLRPECCTSRIHGLSLCFQRDVGIWFLRVAYTER
jgi:hypothetical protein